MTKEEALKKIKELEEFIEKAGEQERGFWRPKDGEEYYSIDSDGGEVCFRYGDDFVADEFRLIQGNMFRTTEEAQNYFKYLEALGKVRMYILEQNGDWRPDWKDGDQNKCFLAYDYSRERFKTTPVWFTAGAHVLPYMKSEELFNEVVEKFEPELRIIWEWNK